MHVCVCLLTRYFSFDEFKVLYGVILFNVYVKNKGKNVALPINSGPGKKQCVREW